jgi:hypothetical protein
VRFFSLKRGISVSFQAITYLKSGPKQLGSLIILAQNISNFGNGMHGMALLSLRLHCSNNLVSHHLAAVSSPRYHACPCQ